MEERTVALGHGRLPRIRADVQRGLEAQVPPAQTHDAPNDSQMILSFTGHPLTVARLGQLGTNQPARKAGATPQRSLQLQRLDAMPRLMTGSLRLYASCSQGPGPPSPEHRFRPGSTWNGSGPRSEPPGPRVPARVLKGESADRTTPIGRYQPCLEPAFRRPAIARGLTTA
jgi:hypothetical protein